ACGRGPVLCHTMAAARRGRARPAPARPSAHRRRLSRDQPSRAHCTERGVNGADRNLRRSLVVSCPEAILRPDHRPEEAPFMRMLPSHGLFAVLIALALAVPSRADKADVDKLNKKVDSFSLQTADDKTFSLADLKAQMALVLLLLSFARPVSNSYSPTLIELHKTYSGKGVAFVAVNASDDLSAAELVKKAEEYKLPFAVLKDDGRKAADAFK